ncbi:MAG: hypothetical protein ACKVJ3_05740, partial [bacterium]
KYCINNLKLLLLMFLIVGRSNVLLADSPPIFNEVRGDFSLGLHLELSEYPDKHWSIQDVMSAELEVNLRQAKFKFQI